MSAEHTGLPQWVSSTSRTADGEVASQRKYPSFADAFDAAYVAFAHAHNSAVSVPKSRVLEGDKTAPDDDFACSAEKAKPPPARVSRLPSPLRRSEAWCSAKYCTPHAAVPGQLHVTASEVHFIAEQTSSWTQEFGEAAYEVVVNVADLVECAAVVMPVDDQEQIAYYLQLHVRTLDGSTFCETEDVDHSWCVVFEMQARSVLYKSANILLESISFHKELGGAVVETQPHAQGTRVPYPSLECAAFLEAAVQKQQQQRMDLLSDFLGAAVAADQPVEARKVLLWPGNIENTLLTEALASELSEFLPLGLRIPGAVRWVLRYTPKAHGVSLSTLYRNVAEQEPTVLLVQDTEEYVFGGFAPKPWEPRGRFYGAGEAFVFSFGRIIGHSEESRSSLLSSSCGDARIFQWTMRNNFFMYGDHELLAMGGGDGHHAIAIFSDLLRGRSQATETYGNPVLASAADFVIRDLELWAFEDVV